MDEDVLQEVPETPDSGGARPRCFSEARSHLLDTQEALRCQLQAHVRHLLALRFRAAGSGSAIDMAECELQHGCHKCNLTCEALRASFCGGSGRIL